MQFNQDEIKKLFIPDLADFQELMGNYFLEQLNETNSEILDALSTLLDCTQTGNARFKVYINDDNVVNSERYYSMVNTYNIIRFGALKTYTPSGLEG